MSMTALYIVLLSLIFVLVALNVRHVFSIKKARQRGKLPPKGKGTMFDVRHLLMEGEKELAVELYCEIFNTNAHKAAKDIAELERSLKV